MHRVRVVSDGIVYDGGCAYPAHYSASKYATIGWPYSKITSCAIASVISMASSLSAEKCVSRKMGSRFCKLPNVSTTGLPWYATQSITTALQSGRTFLRPKTHRGGLQCSARAEYRLGLLR